MIGIRGVCLEDRGEVRRLLGDALRLPPEPGLRFHDTFPIPPDAPKWPDLLPDPNLEESNAAIEAGYTVCGDPEGCIKQIERFESYGVTQVALPLPYELPNETVFKILNNFGEYIIPYFDKESVHSTTRYPEASHATA